MKRLISVFSNLQMSATANQLPFFDGYIDYEMGEMNGNYYHTGC
ncbi:hypothetical protein [Segetibacter koreensis]|nr:hypothetical protein [Segetibacter koreensis]